MRSPFHDLKQVFLLLLILVSSSAQAQASPPVVARLRCEFRADPLGIDVPRPRLGWIIESARRGEVQTAYQVLAASTPEGLAREQADLWDSGRVESDQTVNVPYDGKTLGAAAAVHWKVRSWDGAGQTSAWSVPGRWTMGLLQEADWQGARWIGMDAAAVERKASTLLRRDFVVRPGLRRAVAFVCGLGYYDMTLNGGKVTDDLLTPGWSKYDKTCLYDTYEVTAALTAGRNTLGLCLGNGMYHVEKTNGRYTKFNRSFGFQQAIVRVRLEYQDGTVENVVTDEQWRADGGPITFNSVYGGEDHDARLEQRGWDRPGFDAAKWVPATVGKGPGGTLRGLSCAAPAVRAFEIFKPLKTNPLRPGVTVYDLGQNAAQRFTISVQGPTGSTVVLRPAELVKDDGSVDQQSTGGSGTYCTYTLAGGRRETWSPQFFYSGYRYLQVECAAPKGTTGSALPVVESLQSAAVNTSAPSVGEFTTSSDLFNRIYTLVRWAQRSNMISVLTDCPHREKLGWLEQIHLNGPALRYNFDLNAFFNKTMNDMADSQRANGMVPTTAPDYTNFGGDFGDSPEWGSALPLVAWQQYQFTGDTDLLRRYYDPMARYVAYLGTRSRDHIVSHGLSDWYDIGPGAPGKSKHTSQGVTATAFYYDDTVVQARAAKLLGRTEDAAKYEALAGQIRTAFNAKFFDANTGQYATGSQCANALPLVMGLADPGQRGTILDNVLKDLRTQGLTAGDIGYRYLLRALAEAGRSDVVFAMNNQSDKPGYGMQLARGATSLTEAWDALRTSSQNHFMLGQINEWFFHDLAGIQPDPDAPGFQRIIIKPAIVGDLTMVRASYDSIHGQIVSHWQRAGDRLTLEVTVPANTTAVVYVPAVNETEVSEGGRPVAQSAGARFLRTENGCAAYAVGSGTYRFTTVLPDGRAGTGNR